MIKIGPEEARAVEAALRAIPQVRLLHSVSGDYDMIAFARHGHRSPRWTRCWTGSATWPGVERTTSSIILSTKFDRGDANDPWAMRRRGGVPRLLPSSRARMSR